jgi:predicted regulator of Ras-like GTPase activity (Roadblock/LC7/MglB family)
MEFQHLFSILAVIGAVLFFTAGFSFAALKSGRAHEKAEALVEQDWAARDQALRESAAREMAASEVAARESAARQAAASDAALRLNECERLRAQLTACQDALKGGNRQVETDHLAAKRAEALNAECIRLRADVKAATLEIARLKSTMAELEHRAGNVPSALPPPVADTATGSLTFQGILGRLSRTKGIRAAVLGDAMGLPVAGLGEHTESLAGFCGFISQAASKARDFLQLGSIRRIVIEDERLATLTACSIPGTDIFLATLTSGPGPDNARMVQVLNDVKSFMSQRSRA